jgi:(2Fe-2S) ferredoxin
VSAIGGAGTPSGTPGTTPKLPAGRSLPPQRAELPSLGTRTLIFMCHGPSCSERGSPEVCRLLRERIATAPPHVQRMLRVCETTCLDSCATGPNVVIGHDGRLRTGLMPADIERFLDFVVGGAQARNTTPLKPETPSGT